MANKFPMISVSEANRISLGAHNMLICARFPISVPLSAFAWQQRHQVLFYLCRRDAAAASRRGVTVGCVWCVEAGCCRSCDCPRSHVCPFLAHLVSCRSAGMIIAEDVTAPEPQPPFRVSENITCRVNPHAASPQTYRSPGEMSSQITRRLCPPLGVDQGRIRCCRC